MNEEIEKPKVWTLRLEGPDGSVLTIEDASRELVFEEFEKHKNRAPAFVFQ